MENIHPAVGLLALEIATSQIGQMEKPKGSNCGPMVNEYLKSVGLKPGYPWCQAFVYWCYEQAAKKLNTANPVALSGSVITCWDKTATAHKIIKQAAISHAAEILPGYQFILSFGKNLGHTGIIEQVKGATIYTIEGNSNTDGSREGYEVVRHQRSLTDKNLLGMIMY